MLTNYVPVDIFKVSDYSINRLTNYSGGILMTEKSGKTLKIILLLVAMAIAIAVLVFVGKG